MPKIIIGKVTGPPGKDGASVTLNGAVVTNVSIEAVVQDGKVIVPNILTSVTAGFDYTRVTPHTRIYTKQGQFKYQDAFRFKCTYGGQLRIKVIGAAFQNTNQAGVSWDFTVGVNNTSLPVVSRSFLSPEVLVNSIGLVQCVVVEETWNSNTTVLLKFIRAATDNFIIYVESINPNPLIITQVIDTEERSPVYRAYKV